MHTAADKHSARHCLFFIATFEQEIPMAAETDTSTTNPTDPRNPGNSKDQDRDDKGDPHTATPPDDDNAPPTQAPSER